MLKKTAGMEKFTEVYASTQKFRSERKDERKRKRAVQVCIAWLDPENTVSGGPDNVFMPPKELWEAYSNRTVRPSVLPSRFRVRSISPIFFEVGIPNLVCGCILVWQSVAYHFRVTVTLTLTSDLVFRTIVSGSYLLYYLR